MKRSYARFTDSVIEEAKRDVKSEMSLRKAARKHDMNRQTLFNKMNALHGEAPGRPRDILGKMRLSWLNASSCWESGASLLLLQMSSNLPSSTSTGSVWKASGGMTICQETNGSRHFVNGMGWHSGWWPTSAESEQLSTTAQSRPTSLSSLTASLGCPLRIWIVRNCELWELWTENWELWLCYVHLWFTGLSSSVKSVNVCPHVCSDEKNGLEPSFVFFKATLVTKVGLRRLIHCLMQKMSWWLKIRKTV